MPLNDMSCSTKSRFKYTNNNDKEKFLFSDEDVDEDGDFDFQFIPVNQFKHIIKDVRRRRNKDEDERIWASYLKEQEEAILSSQKSSCKTKNKASRTLAESLEDVDRELMRLGINLTNTKDHCGSTKSNKEKHAVDPAINDLPLTKENAGSTDLLLTIPEEENGYCITESSDCCRPCRTLVRRSCSEHTFRSSKMNSRYYHHSTNDLDFDYSPDMSPDRLSNDNYLIPVRPDPVAVSKIFGIQKRISTVLDSILYELDRIPLPDGEDDLQRRQQRVIEFSTRLSRNYLYDLGRQISDIHRHIKAISPYEKVRLSRRGIILHMQAIEQKLISAHQLLLTALSAYWKHIPSSVLKNHAGKLKEILHVVMQLKNICTEISITPEIYCSGDDGDIYLGKETENRCIAILSKFRIHSDNESQIPSLPRSAVVTPSRVKKQRNRKALTNRLSMYTMDMRLAKHHQPKKSHSMFQFSRDRKHNCVASKQQNGPVSKKSSLPEFMKLSTGENKGTRNKVPLKEDEIKTIVETVPSDVESPRSCKSGRKSRMQDDLHKTIQIYENTKESERLNKLSSNYDKEVKEDGRRDKCFSSLVPVIGDLLSLVQNKQNDSKSLPAATIEDFYDILQKCQPSSQSNHVEYHETTNEIETGAKNMKLICYSATETENSRKFSYAENEVQNIAKHNDVSCQANAALKDSGPLELIVSESAKQTVFNYRDEYQNLLKSNPLYTSTTQNKPWEVVAWIADKLVEELIVELSDDFQMEDMIQKLFDLEFQEF